MARQSDTGNDPGFPQEEPGDSAYPNQDFPEDYERSYALSVQASHHPYERPYEKSKYHTDSITRRSLFAMTYE